MGLKKSKKIPSLYEAVFLLIIGTVLGTVFIFGMSTFREPVKRSDCEKIKTEFIDYKKIYKRGKVKKIFIECADNEQYFIHYYLIDNELIEDLSELEANEKITLLVHPNRNLIVEFSAGKKIIRFDEAVNSLKKNDKGFLYLGLFMYFCAAFGLYFTVRYLRKSPRLSLNHKSKNLRP